MKKADFLNAIAHEVKTLREIATELEISRLSLHGFNPTDSNKCIYGQMTGSCGSKRAKELMDKACIIVANGAIENFQHATYAKAKKFINGKNEGQGWNDDGGSYDHHRSRNYEHASALEAYICLKDAKVKNVISYLRGEKKRLVL